MSRTPKAYKTRPHRYGKRCGRDLAQGEGLAEPWVLVVKKHVALKERKNPSNAEQ